MTTQQLDKSYWNLCDAAQYSQSENTKIRISANVLATIYPDYRNTSFWVYAYSVLYYANRY
jgi:hypothetical protein